MGSRARGHKQRPGAPPRPCPTARRPDRGCRRGSSPPGLPCTYPAPTLHLSRVAYPAPALRLRLRLRLPTLHLSRVAYPAPAPIRPALHLPSLAYYTYSTPL